MLGRFRSLQSIWYVKQKACDIRIQDVRGTGSVAHRQMQPHRNPALVPGGEGCRATSQRGERRGQAGQVAERKCYHEDQLLYPKADHRLLKTLLWLLFRLWIKHMISPLHTLLAELITYYSDLDLPCASHISLSAFLEYSSPAPAFGCFSGFSFSLECSFLTTLFNNAVARPGTSIFLTCFIFSITIITKS